VTAAHHPHVHAAADALASAGLDVYVRPGGVNGRGTPVVHIDHVRGVFVLEVYPNGDMCLWATGSEAPAYWGVGDLEYVLDAVRTYAHPNAGGFGVEV